MNPAVGFTALITSSLVAGNHPALPSISVYDTYRSAEGKRTVIGKLCEIALHKGSRECDDAASENKALDACFLGLPEPFRCRLPLPTAPYRLSDSSSTASGGLMERGRLMRREGDVWIVPFVGASTTFSTPEFLG